MNETRSIILRITPQFKLRLLLLVLLLLVLQLAMFHLGGIYGTEDGFALRSEKRQLVRETNRQRIELKAKTAEIVRLEKSSEIDRLAAEQVRQELIELREEVASLKKDVNFYRGLMAPGEQEKGFKLHSLELAYDETDQRYSYSLVLANVGGKGQVIKGTLSMQLEARNQQELLDVIGLPEYRGASPVKLRFRFFQNVEGSFKLPEGTEPLALVIAANVKDAGGQLFRLSYNWRDLVAQSSDGGQ